MDHIPELIGQIDRLYGYCTFTRVFIFEFWPNSIFLKLYPCRLHLRFFNHYDYSDTVVLKAQRHLL